MMKFRTEIREEPSAFKIDHQTGIVFIGSCFTDNIGNRLRDFFFPVIVNPFGIVYNPFSVSRNIRRLLEEKEYSPEDLDFYNERWFSFDHHSSFSGTRKEEVLATINRTKKQATHHLFHARYLILTFGTAWIYRHLKTNRVVCNCHKLPQREFNRELLDTGEITDEVTYTIRRLLEINPGIRIVFTISPVRHWKDGAHGNQVSKSTLVLAVEELLKRFPDTTTYFPAYELMLDDLRDYRFYSNDLVHPNDQAVEYIWEKFAHTFFDEDTTILNKEISGLLTAARHRTMFPQTESHRRFLKTHRQKSQALQKKYPEIDFSSLIRTFEEC